MHINTFTMLFLRICIPCACLLATSLLPQHLPVYDSRIGLIRPFLSWDVEWFLKIAGSGYITEQRLAFFPVMPLLLRHLGVHRTLYLNLTLNVASVLLQLRLYDGITCQTPNPTTASPPNQRRQHLIRLLAFSPVAVFQTVPYAETSLTLINTAILLIYQDMAACTRKRRVVYYTLLFVLCIIIGLYKNVAILNAGYFLFGVMFLNRPALDLLFVPICYLSVTIPLKKRLEGYYEVCIPLNAVHSVYSEIQRKYWSVGFLAYWRRCNVPRFLLAFPWAAVSAMFAGKEIHKWACAAHREKTLFPSSTHMQLAISVHGLVLTGMVLLVANVEILPRILLSSCPFLLAQTPARHYTFILSVILCVVGALLFGTFLPWT